MAAGTPVLAEDLDAQNDQIDLLSTPALDAWTSYTPTWTVSAGSVSIGNGSLSGRYMKVGRTVDVVINWQAGSTTTYGTAGAYWQFSLPSGHSSVLQAVGVVALLDAGTLEYGGYCKTFAGTVLEMFKPVSGRIVNNSPFTFGTSDSLSITIRYENTS